MKSHQINFGDWNRMFFGEAPPEFFIEIIIRALIIYAILMIAMRLMGKRMSSQLGRNELAAVVSLAGAIGVPIQVPDKGLMPTVIIAAVVVIFERAIAHYAAKNQKFEQLSQDDIDVLVEDGRMKPKEMKRTRITRERLMAQLRSEALINLGAVKRLYLEANGNFTLIQAETPEPGLLVLPQWDKDFIDAKVKTTDRKVCGFCGDGEQDPADKNRCANCGSSEWVQAVEEKQ